MKNFKIIIGVIIILLVIAGIVFYFKNSGSFNLASNSVSPELQTLLEIDESKFVEPEGLTQADYDQASANLKNVRNLIIKDPTDAQSWFDFGYFKEFFNDHTGAVAAWKKSLEIGPYNYVAWLDVANADQYFLKNYAEAETSYLKVLEIKSDITSAYRGLMDLYQFNWKEQQDKYEPLVLEAIAKDPNSKEIYYSNLVEFFASSSTQNLTKARKYLAEVKKMNPASAEQLVETYPVLK